MASLRRYKAYFNYYSGRAKYLFLHIPKNAGVAIKKSPMLQSCLVATEPWFYRSSNYYREMLATMKTNDEHHGIHHARLRDIHPKIRNRLQAVAIVRNPWARVVSRYRFALAAMACGGSPAGYAPTCFEEFLEERHIYGDKDYYWHRAIRGWYPQYNYVVNESGEIEPHILRHESLSEEAKRYFGIENEVRPRNVSRGKFTSYHDYYSAKTIQIVADWYAKDIEMFGFDFDSQATKNCHYDLPQTLQSPPNTNRQAA